MPTPAPKHAPFQSIYRENFEVVQERRGRLTLYPHTNQLPLLLRALNLEFYGALPGRIARVDHRGDGFHKLVLHYSAMMFCQHFNRTRADRLVVSALQPALRHVPLSQNWFQIRHHQDKSRAQGCHLLTINRAANSAPNFHCHLRDARQKG